MGKWSRIENEADYKLSEESAEKLVREFLDFYEIDVTHSDPKIEKALDEMLDELMKAYRRGAVENHRDDNLGFCVIQNLKNGNKLTYRELAGKDRIFMEGYSENQSVSKIHAILGRLCGYGPDVIAKISGRDWQTATNIALVFMKASNG